MSRHCKGAGLQYRNAEVMGRLLWNPTHPSPWVLFRNITEYRKWATAVRKARPGTKTDYLVNIHWTPDQLLRRAAESHREAAKA
jgi:hypothetical protein